MASTTITTTTLTLTRPRTPINVVFDPSSMSLDEDLKPDDPSPQGIAANLSGKKGQAPQPSTKKLVIKLIKVHLLDPNTMSYFVANFYILGSDSHF
ncbi:hypothetical protein C1H46_029286 [Malus baccata]|uniref:Uncharacterized protein n=1 Tax=Malus baccata TaxID=106549 RepID=A0A540LFD9_MALBA|nr:hypothetical protein C1H46_029286 [Malus baccata]